MSADVGPFVPKEVRVGDRRLVARSGEALLLVLARNGLWALRGDGDEPRRGPFCNMGVCQECVVTVAGRGTVLACQTTVDTDLIVRLGMSLDG